MSRLATTRTVCDSAANKASAYSAPVELPTRTYWAGFRWKAISTHGGERGFPRPHQGSNKCF